MKYILNTIAIVSLLYGLLVVAGAKSAIHEIEAGVSFVIFVIAIGFAGVISRLPGRTPSDEEKVCTFCQENIKAKALVCRFCGREVSPKAKAPPPADLNHWTVFEGKPKFKFCPQCGGENLPEVTVCGGCGWKPKAS